MAGLEELELVPPIEFPFPFEPYSIQKDFMRELYVTLERGQVGIFESPTGTGKSLSIICGALKWLLDREQKDKSILTAVLEGRLPPSSTAAATLPQFQNASVQPSSVMETTKKEPDWFALFDQKKAEKETLQKVRDEVERKERCKASLKKLKEEHAAAARWKAKRKREASPTFTEVGRAAIGVTSTACVEAEDADIVVAEYCSDEEEATRARRSDSEEEEVVEEDYVRKIFYCSRTHSQLAQFVREVQKSPYSDEIQVITLGSRQNLCINPEVTRLKSLALMNDRCLDMQKSKKTNAEKKRSKDGQAKKKQQRKGSSGTLASCPYYKLEALVTFRDLALTKVQDMEQLVVSGREVKACPYYGVRRAIPAAQLVVLPYNTLLHGPTREAVGVHVKGSVVIIDEAHNLLDTISSVYSSRITGSHVAKASSQLSQYMEKYRSRLKARNLMYINQILQVLNSFLKVLQVVSKGAGGMGQEETKLVRLNDFLFTSNMDNINIFKILRYCKKSLISRKLNGFVDRYFDEVKVNSRGTGTQPETCGVTSAGGGEGGHQQMKSPLMLIEGFLQALTNMDTDGRIIITKKVNLSTSSLKFLLLNPSVQFSHIVKEASAVVLAGGTMQPADELKDQLLAKGGLSASRLVEFTCGHVIPADHMLPLVLCKGPAGEELEFSFLTRDRDTVMSELGRILVNLSAIVPGGMVCLFPSYDYENKVHTYWDKTGILDKLQQRKKVFREPKVSSQVDHVLSQYARHIQRCDTVGDGTGGCGQRGAILLCIVGGKLSEGINFSDDLGRCVVMVGLPYPNITSPELKEKMAYMNSTMSRHSDGRLPGQVHYENLCMKAVNQSIGRAIRHSEDYACILLVDARYERHSVNSQLPHWISKQLQVGKTFGPAFATIRKFFNAKKAAT